MSDSVEDQGGEKKQVTRWAFGHDCSGKPSEDKKQAIANSVSQGILRLVSIGKKIVNMMGRSCNLSMLATRMDGCIADSKVDTGSRRLRSNGRPLGLWISWYQDDSLGRLRLVQRLRLPYRPQEFPGGVGRYCQDITL